MNPYSIVLSASLHFRILALAAQHDRVLYEDVSRLFPSNSELFTDEQERVAGLLAPVVQDPERLPANLAHAEPPEFLKAGPAAYAAS